MRPPTLSTGGPRSRDHQAAPPQPPESSTRGPGGTAGEPPPSPPPPPPSLPQPTDSRRPAMGTAAPHPPRAGPGGRPPPPERAPTPGEGVPRYALLYAACRQSATRPLPQYPQQAGSPAPARKGTPRAAPGRQHADVSRSSLGRRAMTRRPASVPARGGRRDGPRQSDLPPPAPRGPLAEPP